jgi:hypothetical protein
MEGTLVHHVWSAPVTEDKKNKAILPALDKIADAGGVIEVIHEGALLAGLVNLPFIETPNGERYYGIDSIQGYAETYRRDAA